MTGRVTSDRSSRGCREKQKEQATSSSSPKVVGVGFGFFAFMETLATASGGELQKQVKPRRESRGERTVFPAERSHSVR